MLKWILFVLCWAAFSCDRSKAPYEEARKLEEAGSFEESLVLYEKAAAAGGTSSADALKATRRIRDILAVRNIDGVILKSDWDRAAEWLEALDRNGVDYGRLASSGSDDRVSAILNHVPSNPFPKPHPESRSLARELVRKVMQGLEDRRKGQSLAAYSELAQGADLAGQLGISLGGDTQQAHDLLSRSVGSTHAALERIRGLLASGDVEAAYVVAMELQPTQLPHDAVREVERVIGEVEAAKARQDTERAIRMGEFFALAPGKVIYQNVRQDAKQMHVKRTKILGTHPIGRRQVWMAETEESLRVYGAPEKGYTRMTNRYFFQDGLRLLDYGSRSRRRNPDTGDWTVWSGSVARKPSPFEIRIEKSSGLNIGVKSYSRAIKLSFVGEGEAPLVSGWYVAGEGLVKEEAPVQETPPGDRDVPSSAAEPTPDRRADPPPQVP